MPLIINDKFIGNIPEAVSKLIEEYQELKTAVEDKEWSIDNIQIIDGDLVFTLKDGSEFSSFRELNTIADLLPKKV